MALPPISFSGLSDFSDSFQTILERTFQVASLPKLNLETERTVLEGRQTELAALRADLLGLQNVFTSLGLAGAQGAVTAASSDTDVASVAVNGTVSPGFYDLDVTSAASAAQEATLAGLADRDATALSADGIYKLTLGATTTTIDLLTIGSGRTAGTTGSATPSPKVSVDVAFSGGLSGSVSAELESFFVASAAPATVGAGDTVSVTFTSTDGSISETITTATLAGGEDAAALASALNTAIAANAELNGKVGFSDEGGNLKLVVDETAGVGFDFTSTATGTTVSGLESGGTVGGHSAEEIAAALNQQVANDAELTAAGVRFTAIGGEVRIEGNQAFDVAVTDNAQGTGFASGLAGAHSIAGFDNTLEGLRDYLNADSSLGVSAAVINTSSDAGSPSYHLTIAADDTGATTLRLDDSGDQNLLTAVNQGADAVFTLNGLSVQNSSNTIVDFAPGLSLTINGAGQTTISAGDDVEAFREQLRGFATAYNAVVARLNTQIGEDAGVLSGDALIRESKQVLREITGYVSGSGDVQSLAALGLQLSDEGLLSFNEIAFNAVSISDFDAVRDFIGTTTEGLAGTAFNRLKQLTDPVSGQIETAIGFLEDSAAALDDRIARQEERIDQIIANLEAQFAAADQLLAQLESQQSLLTRLFEAQSGDS